MLDRVAPVLADGSAPATQRFQQTSGMVMAKGVEDCAFYRWARLTSLNEVGGDPADVHPVTTEQYGAEFGVEAPRPRESTLALDKIKAAGFGPTNWRAALALYVALR